MFYINLLELLIILVLVLLFIIWKVKGKKNIFRIFKILAIIGFIISIFPYNVFLSFSHVQDAFEFFNGRNRIIHIFEQDKQIVFIYNNRKEIDFASYYEKNKRWKENIFIESTTKWEYINSNDYEIKTFKLVNDKLLTVILKNNDHNNLEYEVVYLNREEIKNYNFASNILYYGIMEQEDYISIEDKIIKL